MAAASCSAGCPGVAAATVIVIGGGVVGMNAAFIAIGMEADVFVFDKSIDRLRELDVAFGGRCSTVYSSTLAIEEMLPRADLVIGAVLVHGARAPLRDPARAARTDEAGGGAGRRRDRPGRLLRDLAPDHAPRPDLRGGRGDPLLRRQHAGRGADHLDLRAHQRDDALRAGARRARAGGGHEPGPGPAPGRQRRLRQGHPPGGRRCDGNQYTRLEEALEEGAAAR